MEKIKINGVIYWNKELSNISKKAKIGNGTIIHSGVHIHDGVIIGKHCKIEAGALIFNGVTIEDNVFIGPGVIFTNDPNPSKRDSVFKPTPTLIKEGATIGAGANLLAGITIGRKALIAMGAVVINDVPDNEVWGGVPARKLK